MVYLTQTLFVPWFLAALALGVLVGWWSTRRQPQVLGLGWLVAGAAIFVVALFVAATLAIPGRLGLWFDTALHFLFWYIVGCCLGTLMALAGRRDDRVEPVAAWVKPVPTEGGGAEPPPWTMPGWVRVMAPAGSTTRPVLEEAHDWLTVVRRGGPDGPSPVPAWVRPVVPSEPAGGSAWPQPAAVTSRPSGSNEVAQGFVPGWLRTLRGSGNTAPSPVPDWARPILPGAAASSAALDSSPPWQAVRTADGVTVTGEAASEDSRARMIVAARKALKPLTVTDQLRVGAGTPALETMAGTAFGHLAKLDRGIASVVGGRYTLTGVARTAADRAALVSGTGALPAGFSLARLEIAPPAATDQVFDGERPQGLAGPRDGKADDLKRIRGIGPQNEGRLHGLGIWHFDQVAAWTPDNALWVGSYLAFPGRIEREDWVGQAKLLAAGADTEFSKRVAKGLVATSRDDGTLGSANVDTVAPRRKVEGAPPKETGKRTKA